ncbi:ATP-grasp domain-containing protein [Rhizobium sp.]|jgi:hypothetical protein|uniref:ATP-grasp domain-containing protein n=1 Tax=Rhizobium sp. TaxID=391 RepID=UPI000E9F5023|nr:hypothetical protein [Rhizobium sp.]
MPILQKTPRTILITGARAPVALHLARLFHHAGDRVVLADTPAHPIAAASKACSTYHRLPPPRFELGSYAKAVSKVLKEERIDVVVPTCEEVFYLGQIWRDQAMIAPLFAPRMDLLMRVHNKHDFIRVAASLGLATPHTTLLQSQDDLEAMRSKSHELVFKPVWSRFASHVLLRPRPKALSRVFPTVDAPWVAQEFIDGDEISVYAVAVRGDIKAFCAYASIYRAGKGAGVCFRPVSDTAARSFVQAFVSATNWTGQISFDLMRTKDGDILPLECNPRATSGVHFFTKPEGFATAFFNDGAEILPDFAGAQGVKLAVLLFGLPQALKTGEMGKFSACLREITELLEWPNDSGPRKAQVRALREIASTAIRQRISLQKASTRDIEWNGPYQSSR